MTVRTIYPKNQATGTGNDTDTLMAAVAACNPNGGDVILMKAVAQGTSTPTPWALYKPHGNAEDITIYLPNNKSYQWYRDWEIRDLHLKTQAVGIDRGVTFRGEVDGDGKAATVLRQYATQEAFHAARAEEEGSEGFRTCVFIPQKNVHPRFENLKIQWCPFMMLSNMPFDVVNCAFDGMAEALDPLLDDRYVFPHLLSDPGNFSDMQGTLIKDCTFEDCQWMMFCEGSGITVEGCELLSSIEGQMGIVMCGEKDVFNIFSEGSIPVGVVQTKYCKNNVARNNVMDFDGRGNDYACAITMSSGGASEGVCEDNEIYGNEISNKPGFGIEYYAYFFGITRRNSGYGNTFNKTQCPLSNSGWYDESGVLWAPSDNMFTDNIIIDVAHAPTGPFWTGMTSSGKSPGAWLFDTRNCQFVKNDWTLSQLPPLSNTVGTYESGIAMDRCQSCVIAESGKWPTGQGGTINFVSDVEGYKNRIVGGKASTAERPAGIGQYITSTMKQAKAVIHAKKHGGKK